MATSIVLVFAISSSMFCEAGVLPPFPTLPSISFPTISLPNPFDGARGWYLPDFGNFKKFWSELPGRATSFLTKLVPRPIKDLLNFDPAPNWVPDPEQFEISEEEDEEAEEKAEVIAEEKAEVIAEEKDLSTTQNITDLSGQGSELISSRSRSFNVSDSEDPEEYEEDTNVIPHEEKGNLHGIGRQVLRTLTNTFDTIAGSITHGISSIARTTGLDTNKTFFTGFLNDFKDRVKAIYPGTQWCGDGNIARSETNLGYFRKTDNCCREHDNCPDFIEKDGTKHGLANHGLFTRSHCDCDTKFYNCLKASDDVVSNQIGTAYFTVLGPQCFKKEYPILYCRIQVGLMDRCIEYELDNSTKKIYQWFDNPEF